MIINQFYILRAGILPAETNPPPIVHSNAVLTLAVSLEFLQVISRRHVKIGQRLRRIEEAAGEKPRPWLHGLLHPILVYRSPAFHEGSGGAQLNLQTLDGALRLTGDGQWTGARLRFRGQATAAPGQESALASLLNIIGRRQGALSVISIG